MLDLDVQPERSLGNEFWEFVLGMPLHQAITLIKFQSKFIKNVNFLYNDQDNLLSDLIIDLKEESIRLYFDSDSQRLKMIESYDLTKVKLRYCNEYFSSPSVQPTIQRIDRCFGATHPAEYNADKSIFFLHFRGLSFQFKVDSKYETKHIEKFGTIEYPTHSAPVVTNLVIFSGPSSLNASVPSFPLSCVLGGLYLHKLELTHNRNLEPFNFRFYLISDISTSKSAEVSSESQWNIVRDVHFGDSCEDILSAIGSPNQVHYKDEDKMRIHCPKDLQSSKNNSDYFFNYTNYGVDILFDASTHRVKKLILHSNYPNHYDFNMYYRCQFLIPLMVAKQQGGPQEAIDVTFKTKWSSIEKYIVTPSTKPVILNRTSENNPFGPTYCFGYKEFIFEVMSNGHIASVTVFQPNLSRKLHRRLSRQ